MMFNRLLRYNILKRSFSQKIKFYFLEKNNIKIPVEANIGDSILDIAHKNEIDLEGACESSLACSTCHVILEEDIYEMLPEPEMEEEDLLDLAFGLTLTSRLGCQVKVTKDFENRVITLPKMTRNMYIDGHKPQPH